MDTEKETKKKKKTSARKKKHSVPLTGEQRKQKALFKKLWRIALIGVAAGILFIWISSLLEGKDVTYAVSDFPVYGSDEQDGQKDTEQLFHSDSLLKMLISYCMIPEGNICLFSIIAKNQSVGRSQRCARLHRNRH